MQVTQGKALSLRIRPYSAVGRTNVDRAMTRKRADETRSRAELLAELAELRARGSDSELRNLVHELEVHQEELRLQQVQLLDSRRALEDARDRYAELFDFAPVAYVVLDPYGVVSEANLAAARLLEVHRSHLLGKPLTNYVAAESRKAALNHLLTCGRTSARVETEMVLCIKDGAVKPVQLISSPLAGRALEPLFHTAIVDVTERRRLEEERAGARDEQRRLLHAEQLARAASDAKDRFLAMISHELRTPLTPILFALDSLKARGLVPESLQPTVEMIRRNVLLETRLIDDLLDMTRIVQEKLSILPEVVDAHELINDVVVLYREQLQQAKVTLTIEAHSEAHTVRADPVRLRQVLCNLLNNAVRNTPAGGRVTVCSENRRPQWLTMVVSDTGRGIDPDMLARIFTLYSQDDETRRRGVGLGLGLAISKAIVESHGGRISAASEGPGRGASFMVELPCVAAQPTASTAARRPVAAPAQPTTVLLVEDNEDSAIAMAEFLRLHGYGVKVAASVREALGLVDGTDLVVSDISLPDGTGHDLMRQITAQRPMRAIALSGYGTAEDTRRSTEAGFLRHIVKPVEPLQLLDAINEVCRVPPHSIVIN
jgi:PAS domain S-box-containing protein